MHITPPVTAERYDGSHHPKYGEWLTSLNMNSESVTTEITALSAARWHDKPTCTYLSSLGMPGTTQLN